MNYLVHLYLSPSDPDELLGSLMGDFVKGRLPPGLPPGFRRGIECHRRVDSFAHAHPVIRRSRQRLDSSFGHYRPILIDIFYDHYLARTWERHADRPLPDFAREIYRLLQTNLDRLPPGLQRVAPRMIAHDWLVSYREEETIGLVLERIGERLRRPNPVHLGLAELKRNYREMEGDFEDFLAAAVAFFRKE